MKVLSLAEAHLTDLGNAKRLAAAYGDDIRWVPELGWLHWDGRRWKRDSLRTVERLAKNVVLSLYELANQETNEHTRRELARHAVRSEGRERIRAMVDLAATEEGIAMALGVLEQHPHLFNVLNGTIDLRTGEIRPHRKEDYLTHLAPVEYDPGADAPMWRAFLTRIFDADWELINWLQVAVGYSCTGLASEEVVFLCYGVGNNGKTTFLETLRSMMGDYAATANMDLFAAKVHSNGLSNDLARLAGKRLITASEADVGMRIAEGQLKRLTGRDTVAARFLYREYFEFEPVFKPWLAVNHKPIIRDTTISLWRRIRLVPFTQVIPQEERNPALRAKLKQELPGILAWAVHGAVRWYSEGLGTVEAVDAASQKYRSESDPVGQFIQDRCIVGDGLVATTKELYQHYQAWAEETGEPELSKVAFGRTLEEKGFHSAKFSKGTRGWKGLAIADHHQRVLDEA